VKRFALSSLNLKASCFRIVAQEREIKRQKATGKKQKRNAYFDYISKLTLLISLNLKQNLN